MAEGAAIDRRRDWTASLDAFVDRNRFTIAVVFPTVGAVTLVASAEGWLPPLLAFNPLAILVGVAVMRLPLIAGLAPLTGRRAVAGVGTLVTYAYVVEYVGLTTGLPYGEFAYGGALGPTVAGVPVGLPLFFVPLVVNAALLVGLLAGERLASPLAALPAVVATVVAMDLVLDPGAVALGFWTYAAGGAYYGVPWVNVAGWVVSATVAVACLEVAYDRQRLAERLRTCPFMLDDLVSFVLLWGGVNAYYGRWVAVAIAAGFGVALLRADRFDFDVLG